jgi:hypothetical protein
VKSDPSDPEANNRAFAAGYAIIHGGVFNKEQWANINRAAVVAPAGQVFPTPNCYRDGQGFPERVIDPWKWTPQMKAANKYARILADGLFRAQIDVRIVDEPKIFWAANYGHRTLTLNAGRLGKAWFGAVASEQMNQLLLHEFAHEYCGNHLSEEYHRAICKLGARLARLALTSPQLFDVARYQPEPELSGSEALELPYEAPDE